MAARVPLAALATGAGVARAADGALLEWNERFGALLLPPGPPAPAEDGAAAAEPPAKRARTAPAQQPSLWALLGRRVPLEDGATHELPVQSPRPGDPPTWVSVNLKRLKASELLPDALPCTCSACAADGAAPAADSAAPADDVCSAEILFVQVEDVTRRHNAEKRFDAIIESTFDGFWDWYLTRDYEYMSPRFWHMFGYKPHEKSHHPSAWQDMIFEEDLKVALANLEKHIASHGEHPYFQEVRYRHKNGSTVTVLCKGHIVEWTEDGSPYRMIGTHTDITALRNKEKEIRIEQERAEAEARLNEFIAHEVRNPLTVALSATHFLGTTLKLGSAGDRDSSSATPVSSQPEFLASVTKNKQEEEAVAGDIELIRTSLHFINDLLGSMIDLNKVFAGKATFKIVSTEIYQDVLLPVRSMLRREASSLELKIDCDHPLWIKGDSLRLKQVLMNLAKNSAKFVEQGFIRLHAHRPEDNPAVIILAVEDSGPGVPPDQHPLLFQRYQESLDLLRQGTGIGLCLCKMLVEAMGGTIALDTAYDSGVLNSPGARFVITLPCEKLDMASTSGSSESAGSLSRKSERRSEVLPWVRGTCLLVDDEALVRKVMHRRLVRIFPNLAIEEASSGEVALELVEADMSSSCPPTINLVFIDQYMPGPQHPLSGEETIRSLRSNGFHHTLIGCSANNVANLHTQAGADGFIRKPFGTDTELANAVIRAMRSPVDPKFLLVDDNVLSRTLLQRTLLSLFPTATFIEEQSAKAALSSYDDSVDVVILDEHLSTGETGTQCARDLRQRDCKALLIQASGSSRAFEHLDDAAEDQGLFDEIWSKPYPPMIAMKRAILRFFMTRNDDVPVCGSEPGEVEAAEAFAPEEVGATQ